MATILTEMSHFRVYSAKELTTRPYKKPVYFQRAISSDICEKMATYLVSPQLMMRLIWLAIPTELEL